MPQIYVLDTNVFIQAKRKFYAFDICPGYWKTILWHRARGSVVGVDRVCDEMENGKDDLWEWVKGDYGVAQFASTDVPGVIQRYGEMVVWVQAQPQYTQAAKEEFAREEEADGWVAAYAKATQDAVVVTLEEANPEVRKRVPLPNICQAFDVECISPFEMLRRLNVQLDWEEPA